MFFFFFCLFVFFWGGGNTARKLRKISRFFRFWKHEFSLLGQTQWQHLLLEFCVSIKLYKQAFNTTSEKKKKKNDQRDNGREFSSLRKFACPAGARGFRQTVATSCNMLSLEPQPKKCSVDYSSLDRTPTVLIERFSHVFAYHRVKLCSHHNIFNEKMKHGYLVFFSPRLVLIHRFRGKSVNNQMYFCLEIARHPCWVRF